MTYMQVSEIAAEGVLGEFSYHIPFEDGDRLRLIYAPNGRGKTNLLRAISFVLNPTFESLQALIDIPVKRVSVEFSSGDKIELRRESAFEGEFTISFVPLEGASLKVEVDPADFSGRFHRRVWSDRADFAAFETKVRLVHPGSVFIGDDRLAPGPDETRDPRGDLGPPSRKQRNEATVAALLRRVERMLLQQTIEGLSDERNPSGVYGEITRVTLKGTKLLNATPAREALQAKIRSIFRNSSDYEKYGLMQLRQLRDISAQINAARSNDSKFPALHRILMPYLDSLSDQIQALEPAQRQIDTFVTAVNSFLDRKSLRFSAARGITLHGRDGSVLSAENLSSGERHLLLLLSQAVLATEGSPLLIIDEPELSLGIEWQRTLLDQLLRCSSSGNVQFLIASHSVQVMGGRGAAAVIQPEESA